MAFDGNGNFVRLHNWTQDAANNIDISASEMDGEDNGFAGGLTLCVTRDGQGKMAADFLPSVDNAYNLGTGAKRWASVNGVPVTSFVTYPVTAAESALSIVPTNLNYPTSPKIDVRRYGAIGNLVADDTVAINNACAVAQQQGGGVVWIDGTMRCLVNSANINVGNRVILEGPHLRPGLPLPYTTAGLQAMGGAIWLNPSYTINLAPGTGIGSSVAGGSSIKGLYILESSLAIPTSSGNAASIVAAYAGTAVTIVTTTTNGDLTGIDCYIGHCLIAGFAQAITGGTPTTGNDRICIEYISGDNTAGIYLNSTNDLARIHHVHFWDFITYYYEAQSWRTGSAIFLDTLAEGCSVEDCFSFGYKIGFNVQGASNVLTNCWADGDPAVTLAGSMSFNLVGNDIKVIGGQASSHATGYYINSGGFVDLQSCSSWGAPANCVNNVYVNAVGYLRIQGGMLWGSAGFLPSGANSAFLGMNSTGIVAYSIDGLTFWDQSGGGNTPALYMPTPAGLVGHIGDNCIYAGSCVPPTQTQKVFNGSVLNQKKQYQFNSASAAFTDSILTSGGNPGSPTLTGANSPLYKQQAFGCTAPGVYAPAAAVRYQADGTPAAGSMPGNIIFSTTPSGTVSLVDRVIINNGGNHVPVSDNAVNSGQSGARWAQVWAANGSIQTSDARLKNVIGEVPGLAFIEQLKPVRYQWKVGGKRVLGQKHFDKDGNETTDFEQVHTSGEVITEDIPGKRIHWGLLAQDVKAAADATGSDFGGWVQDDLEDPESAQSLRYDELVAPLIKAVQELAARNSALEARLAKLERAP